MRLKEPQQRREQCGLRRTRAKLIRPDSGQVKEPLRPPFVGNGGRKR
jgi:hypothetical protein